MPTYTIKPLMLSKVNSVKGPMTYLTYQSDPVVRPYVMWFIQANEKKILVDTAIEADDYRNYHPGFNSLPFEEVQNFEDALAQVGCVAEEIDIVIQTHLHMDHMYNTPKCKNAIIYVQESELEFALNPHSIFEVLFPRDMIKNLNFRVLRGDHSILPGIDVMMVPGHTPGCQAVIVETLKGKAVITGCCSILDNFNPPEDVKTKVSPFATYPVIAPGIHTDLFQSYNSALKIKQVADIIIPMHDPYMAEKNQIP